MKKKTIFIVICGLFCFFILTGCTKDEILNSYNSIVETAGNYELTKGYKLKGEKTFGVDDYTGNYRAEYDKFSGTEYIFGGTSIKRDEREEIKIKCTLNIREGNAMLFLRSGSKEPVALIDFSGDYSNTIELPVGANYIGIIGEDFSGKVDLEID